MALVKGRLNTTTTHRAICPVCDTKFEGDHRSGNGCRWCDHVSVCDACKAAAEAKGKR